MFACGAKVRDLVNETIAKVTAWSLEHAAAGTGPLRGFYNEPFPKHSFRAGLAGKTLACGYKTLSWGTVHGSLVFVLKPMPSGFETSLYDPN